MTSSASGMSVGATATFLTHVKSPTLRDTNAVDYLKGSVIPYGLPFSTSLSLIEDSGIKFRGTIEIPAPVPKSNLAGIPLISPSKICSFLA